MAAELLVRGDVVAAAFPEHNPGGREQQGYRPAVVVGLPQQFGRPRFPVVIVVPLTTDRGQDWADDAPLLYPRLPAGAGGLRAASIALLDQVRSVDVRRLVSWLGSLNEPLFSRLEEGLSAMLSTRRDV